MRPKEKPGSAISEDVVAKSLVGLENVSSQLGFSNEYFCCLFKEEQHPVMALLQGQ
jgi:hypothetical protein